MKNKVTLQINLCPGDYPHAKYLLKHQLGILSAQVDEIILTVDTRRGKGRFSRGWEAYKELLDKFLAEEINGQFSVSVIPVDYSGPYKRKIGEYFFGKGNIPDKDFRGGPFYAYFFGIYKASNNLVFHLDSDIFLGGGSQAWVTEAVQFFGSDTSLFIISPLPGPPDPADLLKGQNVIAKVAPYTWQLNGMSTRIFMLDKSRFEKDKLVFSKPSTRNQLKSVVEGHDNVDLPEHLISAYMSKLHLKRVDFLGEGNGLWSLHPPYRTSAFYDQLPGLIERITTNDLPAKQQGFYDIIDEVCDWTGARGQLKNNRWWKRF